MSDGSPRPSTKYKVEAQELRERSSETFAFVVVDTVGQRLAAAVGYPDHWKLLVPEGHPERDLLMGTLALQIDMSMASGGCPKPRVSNATSCEKGAEKPPPHEASQIQ